MAAKRLHKIRNEVSSTNKKSINKLLRFIRENNDGIVQGAWFPDSVIHDNSTGHIWQLTPDQKEMEKEFTNFLAHQR